MPLFVLSTITFLLICNIYWICKAEIGKTERFRITYTPSISKCMTPLIFRIPFDHLYYLKNCMNIIYFVVTCFIIK